MSLVSNVRRAVKTAWHANSPVSYLVNVTKYAVFRRLLGVDVTLRLRPDLQLVSSGKSASTGCAVLLDVYYEPRLMYFVEDWLKPEDVFVDVGANIGIYSLLAARKVTLGQVVSIEANPNVFKRLERNVASNGWKNVQLVNRAVAATSGTFQFELVDGDCEGHLVHEGKPAPNRIEVRAEPLSDILTNCGIKSFTCMKLDVEGAEIDVLNGCRELLISQTPVILIDYYQRKVTACLEEIGYLPYRYSRGDTISSLTPVAVTAEDEHGSIFIHHDRLAFVKARIESDRKSKSH